jgi:hypothetical protein
MKSVSRVYSRSETELQTLSGTSASSLNSHLVPSLKYEIRFMGQNKFSTRQVSRADRVLGTKIEVTLLCNFTTNKFAM